MRRLINLLGVIAISGLVFALAPSPKAFAKPKSAKNGSSGGVCGSNGKYSDGTPCNCPPHYAFIAIGNGSAVDDLNTGGGCYDPGSGDSLLPNDNSELTCPSALVCGCLLAGGENPLPGTNVVVTGDTDLGDWTITKLEVNFAYGTNTPAFAFIGNETGSGPGSNGSRCYAAAGFAEMVNTSGVVNPSQARLYLELQGTVCDTIPFENPPTEPQKFSFSGSYIVDGTRSDDYYQNWTGTGTFVMSISDVSTVPSAYSASNFSFNGYLLP
jgi:hypothetical protein